MNAHPLDPISTDEIEKAVTIFRSSESADENSLFSHISLIEPDKDLVRNFEKGTSVPRSAKIIGVDSNPDGGFCVDIDLVNNSVTSFERLSNKAQAGYTKAELFLAMELTKQNKEYQEALKKRGITNLELVQIDPWPGGGLVHESIEPGHRALRTISFLKESLDDNAYAKPINGVMSHVDLTLGEVVFVEDHGGAPVPKEHARYDAASQPELRKPLKPIDITQSEGTNFEVEGNHISWQGWKVRVSIHPDEGLVLHQLSLNDRPVIYRAGLSDMVVPYGSEDPMHSWKAVHDGTEYGFGTFVDSLTLGCDCLGEIHYFDTNLMMFDGSAITIENAICLHEEDYGMQWKHANDDGGASEVRRSRRLVISSISTVGNYDYGIFWYLYLDGTIQVEVKLTGIMGISAFDEAIHDPSQDLRITKELVAPLHQHLFCMRLDWDLDGGTNQLFESEVVALPISEKNPHGTHLKAVSKHLKKESEAKRDISPSSTRVWKVANPNKKNFLGIPVAYKLLPGYTPTLLAHPDSPPGKRASFAKHNLWATPYKKGEQAAAGPNTVMHNGEGGLEELTSEDRDISDCDLVMWHTFGVTHVPRPEDWPVMPVEYCGFHLIPVGFFNKNPTLDLPPNCHNKSKSNKKS